MSDKPRKRQGKRKPLPADAQERDDRLKDALRFRRITNHRFCAVHGFDHLTLRRWVQRGDLLLREATRGVSINATILGDAFQLHPSFLRPGGPRLWAYPLGEPIGVPRDRSE